MSHQLVGEHLIQIYVRVPNKDDNGSHEEPKNIIVQITVDVAQLAEEYGNKAYLNKSGVVREAKGGVLITTRPTNGKKSS